MKVPTIANVNIEELVEVQNQQVVTTSRKVAEVFEKRHDNVIRDIEAIKKDVLNFEEMFREGEAPDSYGRPQKVFFLNRDGLSLLAMGFTGKKALDWKVKYIAAFNQMENILREQQKPTKPLDTTKQMRAEAMLNNSQARKAKLLYEIAKNTTNDLYKQAGEALAVNLLAGKKVMPMPEAEQRANHELGYFCRFIGKSETWASVLGKKLKQAGVPKNAETGVFKVTWDKKNNQRDSFYWFDDVLMPKLAELFPSDYVAGEA